jgi:hypothetical protein
VRVDLRDAYQGAPYQPPVGNQSGGVLPLRLWVRVWAGSLQVDCRLAEGVRSTSSPELTLRAQQLASARFSHQLASALTAGVDAPSCPQRRRPRVVAGV